MRHRYPSARLFGEDHMHYWCRSQPTCGSATNDICMSGC